MSELTSIEFNKIVINLRKVISAALVRVAQKLKRQIDRFKKSKSEEKKRRVDFFVVQIKETNKFKSNRDTISKFALVNVKSLQELKITNETSPEIIVKYKVATNPLVLKEIDEIRKKYTNWFQEIPFILQRFGNRAKADKVNKKEMQLSSKKEEEISIENDKDELTPDIEDIESNKIKEKRKPKIKNAKQKAQKKVVVKKIKDLSDISSINTNKAVKKEVKGNKKTREKSVKRKRKLVFEKNDFDKKNNTDKLHPSWEAAILKKQKLQATISVAINNGQPTGKHVRFDMDDN